MCIRDRQWNVSFNFNSTRRYQITDTDHNLITIDTKLHVQTKITIGFRRNGVVYVFTGVYLSTGGGGYLWSSDQVHGLWSFPGKNPFSLVLSVRLGYPLSWGVGVPQSGQQVPPPPRGQDMCTPPRTEERVHVMQRAV